MRQFLASNFLTTLRSFRSPPLNVRAGSEFRLVETAKKLVYASGSLLQWFGSIIDIWTGIVPATGGNIVTSLVPKALLLCRSSHDKEQSKYCQAKIAWTGGECYRDDSAEFTKTRKFEVMRSLSPILYGSSHRNNSWKESILECKKAKRNNSTTAWVIVKLNIQHTSMKPYQMMMKTSCRGCASAFRFVIRNTKKRIAFMKS